MASWTEQLPSGRWQARFTLPNGKKRSAGTFTHKRAAEKAASVAEAEAGTQGWRDPKAAQRTWAEWCVAWWPTRPVEPGTAKRDASARDFHLIPKWGHVPLGDITRFDVKEWAAELKDSGLAPTTVLRRVYLLSASFTAAIDAEIVTYNPAARIKLPGGETDSRRYLTGPEAAALLAQFRPPFARSVNDSLVNTLLGTGMRWGEGVGLQIKRVHLDRGVITVAEVWDDEMRRLKPYPKGRQIRDVPIPDYLVPLLKMEIGGRKSGFVFLQGGFVVDYSNWRKKHWLPSVRRAGLTGTHIHDLRHTYASWLLQRGISLAEVGMLLGHKSPQTTEIYAKLIGVPSAKVVAVLTDPSA